MCLSYSLIYLIGLIVFIQIILKIINLIYKLFLRKPYNLINRYGSNSWALITGSSDGIGKEFCKNLTK